MQEDNVPVEENESCVEVPEEKKLDSDSRFMFSHLDRVLARIHAENLRKAQTAHKNLPLLKNIDPLSSRNHVEALYSSPEDVPGFKELVDRFQRKKGIYTRVIRKRKIDLYEQQQNLSERWWTLQELWENEIGPVEDDEEAYAHGRYLNTLAMIPDQLDYNDYRRLRKFDDRNRLILDMKEEERKSKHSVVWSDEEKEVFKKKFAKNPKNFRKIASYLPNKTTNDCVAFYYLTKHQENYKKMAFDYQNTKRANKLAALQQANLLVPSGPRLKAPKERERDKEKELPKKMAKTRRQSKSVGKPKGIGIAGRKSVDREQDPIAPRNPVPPERRTSERIQSKISEAAVPPERSPVIEAKKPPPQAEIVVEKLEPVQQKEEVASASPQVTKKPSTDNEFMKSRDDSFFEVSAPIPSLPEPVPNVVEPEPTTGFAPPPAQVAPPTFTADTTPQTIPMTQPDMSAANYFYPYMTMMQPPRNTVQYPGYYFPGYNPAAVPNAFNNFLFNPQANPMYQAPDQQQFSYFPAQAAMFPQMYHPQQQFAQTTIPQFLPAQPQVMQMDFAQLQQQQMQQQQQQAGMQPVVPPQANPSGAVTQAQPQPPQSNQQQQ
jgi:hypothetical protein